jgi:hypothetical protein
VHEDARPQLRRSDRQRQAWDIAAKELARRDRAALKSHPLNLFDKPGDDQALVLVVDMKSGVIRLPAAA